MQKDDLNRLVKRVTPAMCRIYTGDGENLRWIGTAFAIEPHSYLSAFHVVSEYKPDQIYLKSAVFDPPQRLLKIEPHPERDVVLLSVDPAAPRSEKTLPFSTANLKLQDQIVACGFESSTQSLSAFPTTISAYEGDVSQFVAKPTIAQGMSGGAVLLNGSVAGIIVARNTKSGDHYIISIASFRLFLDTQISGYSTGSLTEEQSQLLAGLRTESIEKSIAEHLINTVRTQPATSLIAYHLKRIAHWRQRAFELNRRFINLILLLDHGFENEAGRFLEADNGRFQGLSALLDARPHDLALVLLGRPGCGKTTVLQHFEYEKSLAAILHPDLDPPFVFWMPLNLFPEEGKFSTDPLGWLQDEWRKRNPQMPELDELLHKHPSFLLLDALNEIPHRNASDYRSKLEFWKHFLVQLRDEYPATRAVFSCRSMDYSQNLSDMQAISVPQVEFEALDNDAILDFLKCHLPNDWQTLWNNLKDTHQLKLESTPFYLSLEIRQFRARGRAALGPSELMSGIIWQALLRELQKSSHKQNALIKQQLISNRDSQRIQDAKAWLKTPHRLPEQGTLIKGLIHLADGMQTNEGGGKQISLDVDVADSYLHQDAITAEAIRELGWRLDFLDQDLDYDSCKFQHQLLQEYFAGQAMAKNGAFTALFKPWKTSDVPQETPKAIADPLPGLPSSGWEETTLHAAAISSDAATFVHRVAEQDLVLAARCARSAEVNVSDSLKKDLALALLERSQHPEADLRARIDAGLALGQLGDPRFQRRQGKEVAFILPPLSLIPGGDYTLGSFQGDNDEQPEYPITLKPFEIGQFPVTNAEWQCFMEADGYEDERWWKTEKAKLWRAGKLENTAGIEYYRKLRRDLSDDFEATAATYPNWTEVTKESYRDWLTWEGSRVDDWFEATFGAKKHRLPQEWHNPRFNNHAQPVVGICWYEVLAYCHWLSFQSGQSFRLPSEAEWEATARGNHSDEYPWESGFKVTCANTYESHLRRPSPVGVFPQGARRSDDPVYDLAGNVLEWTGSLYQPYPVTEDDVRDQQDAEGSRVVRGGSWFDPASYARASYRDGDRPDNRLNNLGFRLLLCPPSSGTGH